MKTYNEIRAEIMRLEKEAEEIHQREVAQVINEIKKKMSDYGISLSQLGMKESKKKIVKPKYHNPVTGETWSGRGKAPKWIAEKNKNDFLI